MQSLRLVVGIDVSMDEFHVCAKNQTPDGKTTIKGSRKFSNDIVGFKLLLDWVAKRCKAETKVHYVMEATGVYFEDLAYHLWESNVLVSVVLANKVKHFAKSLNVKTKTDKVDSEVIAQYGIERTPVPWEPMSSDYRELRDLTRERLSLIKERTRTGNQLHALNHSKLRYAVVVKLKHEQIDFYNDAIERIENEIEKLVKENAELHRRVLNICTVKGLGLITVITVLCETNGFKLMENIPQTVSYAGLDIELKESGKYRGRSKISKKGNSRIRQALYMPAITACHHNQNISALYSRVNEKNPEVKRKGIVAAMRKLLIIIFVLWVKNEAYDPNYKWKMKSSGNAEG